MNYRIADQPFDAFRAESSALADIGTTSPTSSTGVILTSFQYLYFAANAVTPNTASKQIRAIHGRRCCRAFWQGDSYALVPPHRGILNCLPVTIHRGADCSVISWQLATMQTFQTFKTTHRKVVSRCRYAQIRGLATTLQVKGMLVTGLVHSLRQDKPSQPGRWIITLAVAKRSVAA